MSKSFLSLRDLSTHEARTLVATAIELRRQPEGWGRSLEGQVVGLYFMGPSTRTRTAFTVAACRLGAAVISYAPGDLQISTGETLSDTARVLAEMLDVLVVRSNGAIADLEQMAAGSGLVIVNAMTACEHPTQAIGDMVTIEEALGRLHDVHIVYYGEGNNTAAALAIMVAQLGQMRLTLLTPQGYGMAPAMLAHAVDLAGRTGSEIVELHDAMACPEDVDVVYTTRWETMGVPHRDADWRAAFVPFQVNAETLRRLAGSRRRTPLFMHDLPAVRGADSTSEVLDGPHSIAFRQARHKVTGAAAVLAHLAGRRQGLPGGPGFLAGP